MLGADAMEYQHSGYEDSETSIARGCAHNGEAVEVMNINALEIGYRAVE